MIGQPEIIRVGELEIRVHRDSAASGGAVAVFESVIPAGARVPVPHRHETYDELVYALAGVCHFTLEGREVALSPGETLFVPRGQAHGFVNRGPAPARLLVVVTPGLLGSAYFREVSTLINAGGPPDLARIAAIMQRHGMTPVLA